MKTILAALIAFTSLSSFASTLNCIGTEPFWNAQITDKVIRFSDPENEKVSLKILSIKNAIGFGEGSAFIAKTKYASAAVTLGECSDGMSDEVYSHTIVLEMNGNVLAGCCNKAE